MEYSKHIQDEIVRLAFLCEEWLKYACTTVDQSYRANCLEQARLASTLAFERAAELCTA